MSAPLRARLIEHLQEHVISDVRRFRGEYPLPPDHDSIAVADALHESHNQVVSALWSLQKMGVVSFREHKQGGAKGASLRRLRISESIRDKAIPEHVRHALDLDTFDRAKRLLEPSHGNPSEASGLLSPAIAPYNGQPDITAGIADDIAQKALIDKVEHGLRQQRALSPVERDRQVDNVVRPIGAGHRRSFVDPTEPSAHGSVAEGGPISSSLHPEVEDPFPYHTALRAEEERAEREMPPRAADRLLHVPNEPHVIVPNVVVEAYPAIGALLAAEVNRGKAADAAALLEAIGMEEQALAVMEAFPSLTPLETDILRLARALGW